MFTVEYWLEGIVRTCELIANKDALTEVWIRGDQSITSIHYYDELFEQLIGDLHLEECIGQFASALREIGAFDDLATFSASLRRLDQRVETCAGLQDPKVLLGSEEWAGFQLAAKSVLALPAAQPYLSKP